MTGVEKVIKVTYNSSGAQKIDVNVRAWQENWHCERIACSHKKDVNDKKSF